MRIRLTDASESATIKPMNTQPIDTQVYATAQNIVAGALNRNPNIMQNWEAFWYGAPVQLNEMYDTLDSYLIACYDIVVSKIYNRILGNI
jgi:hypothetical protein